MKKKIKKKCNFGCEYPKIKLACRFYSPWSKIISKNPKKPLGQYFLSSFFEKTVTRGDLGGQHKWKQFLFNEVYVALLCLLIRFGFFCVERGVKAFETTRYKTKWMKFKEFSDFSFSCSELVHFLFLCCILTLIFLSFFFLTLKKQRLKTNHLRNSDHTYTFWFFFGTFSNNYWILISSTKFEKNFKCADQTKNWRKKLNIFTTFVFIHLQFY